MSVRGGGTNICNYTNLWLSQVSAWQFVVIGITCGVMWWAIVYGLGTQPISLVFIVCCGSTAQKPWR